MVFIWNFLQLKKNMFVLKNTQVLKDILSDFLVQLINLTLVKQSHQKP